MVIIIKNYGKTLKYIRTSKNITQEALSQNIMTRSNLSRLEHGNYDVSFIKFSKLLNRLNLSFEEFFYIHNDYNLNKTETLYQQLIESENVSDINSVKHISDTALSQIKLGNKEYEHIYFTAQSVLYEYNQQTELAFNDLKEYVQNHLIKADNWFLQDFKILNNFLAFFETELILFFVNRSLGEFQKYHNLKIQNNFIVHLLQNTSTILYDRGLITESKKYFQLTQSYGKMQKKLLPVVISECYLITLNSKDSDYQQKLISQLELLKNWGYDDLYHELKAKFVI